MHNYHSDNLCIFDMMNVALLIRFTIKRAFRLAVEDGYKVPSFIM